MKKEFTSGQILGTIAGIVVSGVLGVLVIVEHTVLWTFFGAIATMSYYLFTIIMAHVVKLHEDEERNKAKATAELVMVLGAVRFLYFGFCTAIAYILL